MANRSTFLSEIHATYDLNDLINIQTELALSDFDTGNLQELSYLQNHIGREFYRKLDSLNGVIPFKDPVDAGFRPLTVTGLLEIF